MPTYAKPRPPQDWVLLDTWSIPVAYRLLCGFIPELDMLGQIRRHTGVRLYLDGAIEPVSLPPGSSPHPRRAQNLADLQRMGFFMKSLVPGTKLSPREWFARAEVWGFKPEIAAMASEGGWLPAAPLPPGPFAEPPPVTDALKRDLSLIGLSVEQWDRMDATQREASTRAIAATKAISEQADRQQAEWRAMGRYTLHEAAQAIAGDSERPAEIERKLCDAARSGALRMYAPGEVARYEYVNGREVRTFSEHAYWDGLNAWLAEYEPRIAFRFDEPGTRGEHVKSPTPPSAKGRAAPREKGADWTDSDYRTLYEKSLLPGGTHKALADEYGVSRALIGKKLKAAKDLLRPRKASPLPTGDTGNRKMKGRSY